MGVVDVILATTAQAKGLKYSKLVCNGCKLRGHVNFTGHILPWCILEDGGMAGKTIDESCVACIAHFKAKNKEQKKSSSKITIIPSGGTAFTLEGDADIITAYMAARKGKAGTAPAKAEFAGLASDTLSNTTITDVEALEFDAMIALEEEVQTGVDWGHHTNDNQVEDAALITAQTENLPYYLDLGATVHITPNSSDFITLTPIPERLICGIEGLSIAATGIEKIELQVQNRSTIKLHNVLFVPKSTVQLLSIS